MLQRNNDADASLIDGLQKAAFDYFLLYTNPENGLVADTSIRTSHCSIAAVGFALSSYPVGVERGWISRADAAARVATTLNFFADSHQGQERHATGYRGFYYHFLDMKHGRRAWNSELSMIDTALLLMGVLAAAAYFTGEDETESRYPRAGDSALRARRLALGAQQRRDHFHGLEAEQRFPALALSGL